MLKEREKKFGAIALWILYSVTHQTFWTVPVHFSVSQGAPSPKWESLGLCIKIGVGGLWIEVPGFLILVHEL